MLCLFLYKNVAHLYTRSIYHRNHTSASGKVRGGGVCLYINSRWCGDVSSVHQQHCSIDIKLLMVKCIPFNLSTEFSAVFQLSVYIPPQADHVTALGLHDIITRQDIANPDAVLIVAGDFNHCNPRNLLPKYYQHMCFLTREENILDKACSNVNDADRAVPRPHFGQSDHISVFTLPILQTNPQANQPRSKI